MQVILLKDVGGVGQRNTVKDISDGYAVNYLIPNGLAQQATKKSLAKLETMRKEEQARSAQVNAGWQRLIEILRKSPITVAVRVNDKGSPYQHVTGSAIEKAIQDVHGLSIPKGSVILDKPITAAGEHTVEMRLGSSTAQIQVTIKAL
ncbi:MAG: 50S ribosomal protein L9 [Parcubacteria group bacterium GW2011_GWA2_51_10]|nr:MAG: 50S ribosomal protein L9 [Parcubacteria group bacterium GW2011_GWA2_51_10]